MYCIECTVSPQTTELSALCHSWSHEELGAVHQWRKGLASHRNLTEGLTETKQTERLVTLCHRDDNYYSVRHVYRVCYTCVTMRRYLYILQ